MAGACALDTPRRKSLAAACARAHAPRARPRSQPTATATRRCVALCGATRRGEAWDRRRGRRSVSPSLSLLLPPLTPAPPPPRSPRTTRTCRRPSRRRRGPRGRPSASQPTGEISHLPMTRQASCRVASRPLTPPFLFPNTPHSLFPLVSGLLQSAAARSPSARLAWRVGVHGSDANNLLPPPPPASADGHSLTPAGTPLGDLLMGLHAQQGALSFWVSPVLG